MEMPIAALTAGDVMKGPVECLPRGMSLRAAAAVLRRSQLSGAPVVDEDGRCVGVLSAADVLRWAEEAPGEGRRRLRTCSYQEDTVRADGRPGVLCTLPEGACVLQRPGFTGAGAAGLFCQLPHSVFVDWQQVIEEGPTDEVSNYMTRDVVTVDPATLLPWVARRMIDAHIHRLLVLDGAGRPVGIVTSTDVLAALAALAGNGAEAEVPGIKAEGRT
jgi:CBS domain-containing protein